MFKLPKKLDTPENQARMEDLVATIIAGGRDNEEAEDIALKQLKGEVEARESFGDRALTIGISLQSEIKSEIKKKTSWVQILQEGCWERGRLADIYVTITKSDIQEMYDNFQEKIGTNTEGKLLVNFDHSLNSFFTKSSKAAGWIRELKIEGTVLSALVEWSTAGEEAVKGKEYSYTSVEFGKIFRDRTTGEKHNNVLYGLGLTNSPCVEDLQPIALSLSPMPFKQQFHFTNSEMNTFNALVDAIKDNASISQEQFSLLEVAHQQLTEDERKTVDLSEIKAKIKTPKKEKELDLSAIPEVAKMQTELATLQELSQSQQETIDNQLKEARLSIETQRVQSLADNGQIATDSVEKNAKMLSELSQEQSDQVFSTLSAIPKLDFDKKHGSGISPKASEFQDLAMKKAKELVADGSFSELSMALDSVHADADEA